MSAASSNNLHFPSESAILSYLEQHPLTSKESNPYLSEKKILQAVAKVFANQEKAPMGVDMGVMLTMYDLNEKLNIPQVGVMTIQMNLTAALKDCANGKKIEIEKKTN